MALNFAVFGYLVPYQLIYNHEYLRWRLSRPSEVEIVQYHRGYWLKSGSRRLVESRAETARLKTELMSQQAQYRELMSQQAQWNEQRLRLESECRDWSGRYRAVINSRSWRTTAAARQIASWLRRLRSRVRVNPARYPQRDAAYYQQQHDNGPAYAENNWLLEQRELVSQLRGSSILEFGCGNGRFLEWAASHFSRARGFDWAVSHHIQGVLQRHPNIGFEKRDLVRDFPTITADIAASADFLEHLMPDDLEQVLPLLNACAPVNFHVIACYDDTHSHQTVLPPSDWLMLFRRVSKDYYVLRDWRRDGNANKRVCIVTNYPPPGAARDAFIAGLKNSPQRAEWAKAG